MSDFSWAEFAAAASLAVVGYWAGAKTTRYSAELQRDRDEKRAAAALKVDVERIAAGLGTRAETFGTVLYGIRFEPPTVHRWGESLIVQLAHADPKVVADFMALDRELSNFEVVVGAYHDAHLATVDAEANLKRLQLESHADDADPGIIKQWAVDRLNAESAVERLRESRKDYIERMKDPHKKALDLIASLVRLLDAIIGLPEPEFLELPEEVRARREISDRQLPP